MVALTQAQKERIVKSAKSPEEISAITTLVYQYEWLTPSVLEALLTVQLRVQDSPAALLPVRNVLSVTQKIRIVQSATTRDEVAAVTALVIDKYWTEGAVVEAARQAILKAQNLPPTPNPEVEGSKDDLQQVVEQISGDIHSPLHAWFVGY